MWELYSLQKGQQTSDYHGFLGARDELTESLEKVRLASPTTLIPTHGVVMKDPDRAIEALLNQLTHCYDKYVAISALRHYFPKLFAEFEGSVLDTCQSEKASRHPNSYAISVQTWMIISETGEAFVMDCGSPNVIKHIQQLQEDDEISEVTPVLGDALPRRSC